MNRTEIQSILAAAGQGPQHKFGQNFMVDLKALGAIADAGEIQSTDIVLEVGPGVGNLTRLLAQRAAAVLAVDIDKKLMPAAQRHHADLRNVTWLNADVLSGKHEINPEVIAALRLLRTGHPDGRIKLVSNLPYNAASPLVAELLVFMGSEMKSAARLPLALGRLAFTVQHEVAQRMTARLDTSDYGPLGILIQLMADVRIVRKIPPGAFWPPPKVHSALVVVSPDAARIAGIPDAPALQRLLAGLFSHRRQKTSNGLRHHLADAYTPDLAARIAAAGIDLSLRPEALRLEQFLTLANLLSPP